MVPLEQEGALPVPGQETEIIPGQQAIAENGTTESELDTESLIKNMERIFNSALKAETVIQGHCLYNSNELLGIYCSKTV